MTTTQTLYRVAAIVDGGEVIWSEHAFKSEADDARREAVDAGLLPRTAYVRSVVIRTFEVY